MAIGDGIGNGIEEVKVNEHDDVMGRGFTCLKRHLLIGASGRLCLITRRGIPNARLPLKTYPLDLNLQFAYNTLLYNNRVDDDNQVSTLRCQDPPDLGMRKRTDFACKQSLNPIYKGCFQINEGNMR